MKRLNVFLLLTINFLFFAQAQDNLITNTQGRETISLNRTWYYIIDPYDTGFYDYGYEERIENDNGAYSNEPKLKTKTIGQSTTIKNLTKLMFPETGTLKTGFLPIMKAPFGINVILTCWK